MQDFASRIFPSYRVIYTKEDSLEKAKNSLKYLIAYADKEKIKFDPINDRFVNQRAEPIKLTEEVQEQLDTYWGKIAPIQQQSKQKNVTLLSLKDSYEFAIRYNNPSFTYNYGNYTQIGKIFFPALCSFDRETEESRSYSNFQPYTFLDVPQQVVETYGACVLVGDIEKRGKNQNIFLVYDGFFNEEMTLKFRKELENAGFYLEFANQTTRIELENNGHNGDVLDKIFSKYVKQAKDAFNAYQLTASNKIPPLPTRSKEPQPKPQTLDDILSNIAIKFEDHVSLNNKDVLDDNTYLPFDLRYYYKEIAEKLTNALNNYFQSADNTQDYFKFWPNQNLNFISTKQNFADLNIESLNISQNNNIKLQALEDVIAQINEEYLSIQEKFGKELESVGFTPFVAQNGNYIHDLFQQLHTQQHKQGVVIGDNAITAFKNRKFTTPEGEQKDCLISYEKAIEPTEVNYNGTIMQIEAFKHPETDHHIIYAINPANQKAYILTEYKNDQQPTYHFSNDNSQMVRTYENNISSVGAESQFNEGITIKTEDVNEIIKSITNSPNSTVEEPVVIQLKSANNIVKSAFTKAVAATR